MNYDTFTVYDLTTGLFEHQVTAQLHDLVLCLPASKSCVAGEYDMLSKRVNLTTGEVEEYIPPKPSDSYIWNMDTLRWDYVQSSEEIANDIRSKRNALLTASDWVTLRSIRLGEPIPTVWQEYQTALADLPLQQGFPQTVVWPIIPTT